MTISAAGTAELAAQECGTAWTALLTISHPGLPAPLRVTSDGVITISNGNTFDPFPFELTLPDDSEGKIPRARLRIDNTTQQLIALLRGLLTPPALTVQLVRSAAPDVIEREWAGLEWQSSSYDVGAITGVLGFDDLASEEFPYETFDGRFTGLWP